MDANIPSSAPRAAGPADRRDALFALFSALAGFACSEWILFGGLGVAVPLTYLVCYGFAAAYLLRDRLVYNAAARVTLAPIGLLLGCFALYDNLLLRFFNLLLLWALTCVHLSAATGRLRRPAGWSDTVSTVLRTTFVRPLRHLGAGVRALGNRGRRSGAASAVFRILAALVIVSPLLVIVLSLLGSSDAGFQSLLTAVMHALSAHLARVLVKILVGLILAFPYFSLLYSLRHDPEPERPAFDGLADRCRVLDGLAVAAGLASFCAVYALYIVLQAGYFFSALRGVLPAGFTYAGYARRGFFELFAVAVINFGLIAAAAVLTRRGSDSLPRGCRATVLALIVLTLLLIGTAASKMALYVRMYGLTPLRVYASALMLMLAVTTVLLGIRLITARLAFFRTAAAGVVVLWLALNFLNVDGLVASVNIARYRQDLSADLDISVFYQLSDSAVPALATLADDPVYGADAVDMLRARRAELSAGGWQNFTFSRQAARRAAASALSSRS